MMDSFTFYRGDTARSLVMSVDGLPDLTGATVMLEVRSRDLGVARTLAGYADAPTAPTSLLFPGVGVLVTRDEMAQHDAARFAGQVRITFPDDRAMLLAVDDFTIAAPVNDDGRAALVVLASAFPPVTWTLYPSSPLPTIRSVGADMVHAVRPPHFVIDTLGSAGHNRFMEVGETGHRVDGEIWPPAAMRAYRHELSGYYDSEAVVGLASQHWTQIGFGSMGALPPFPAAPSVPGLFLRWRHNEGRYELVSHRGDGVTPPLIVTPGDASTYPAGYFKLVHDPGKEAAVYINGALIARITDPARLPDFTLEFEARISMAAYTGTPPGAGAGVIGWWGPLTLDVYDPTRFAG